MGAQRDPRAPVFFVSHAHPARLARQYGTRGKYVSRFFDDLSDNVATLISRRAGADPGFIDSRMSGERWEPRVLDMLGTCQVLVPLLSADYLESPWCGMEWHGFSKRTIHKLDQTGSNNHTAIFPVIWAPVRDEMIPDVINSAQRFSPGDPYDQEYGRNGIFGLQHINQDAYEMIVWCLAQEIADSYYCYDVVPLAINRSELLDIFRK